MTRVDPARVRALFDAAADLATPARSAYLAETCGDDAALRSELEALLAFAAGPTQTTGAPASATAPPMPARVGRFTVIDKLGEGGMGVVFRGRDADLDRDLALKLVSHRGGPDGRVRLLREAQAMARVAHPNVVPVYEVGIHGDDVFVAMELVRGTTLGRWLRAERRPWRARVQALVDAGRGLAAAHRAGVLHRDVKPDNILMGDDGRARIVDFGLARAAVPDAAASPAVLDAQLTHHGAVVGTPGYMSPEHFDGEVSAQADQWSLAATAYVALFGCLPFPVDDLATLPERLRTTAPPVPTLGDVPAAVVDAILRGLDPDPAARHASVEAMVDAWAAALAVDPDADRQRFRRQRRGLAIAIAIGGVLSFVAAGVRSDFRFDLPMRWVTVQGLIAVAVLAGAVTVFRRALLGTTHDRHVMALILSAVAGMAAHRLLAGDTSVVDVLRGDAAFAVAFLVLGAIMLERWLAVSAALMAAYIAVSLAVPAVTVPGFGLAFVTTMSLGIWFWREPARSPSVRGAITPAEATRPLGPAPRIPRG